MRLVTFAAGGTVGCGALVGDRVLPIETVMRNAGLLDNVGAARPTTRGILELGPAYWNALAGAVVAADPTIGFALSDVRLLPPVTDPDKILCIGLNYKDHAEETGMAAPVAPIVFAKFRNSLVGPVDDIVLPHVGEIMDYEAELAVVIGTAGRDIPASRALEHVAGVMVFNDFSARDLQFQTSQWTIGKAVDTFAPCGPSLVFMDEIDDVQSLKIEARVNGQTVQSGTTASMIFPIADIIAYVSTVMTLEPGDIIATGTPAGVGYTRDPQINIKADDVVEIEIENVGLIANRVVSRTAALSV